MTAASRGVTAVRRLRVTAPAKVNFGLRLIGRRPDGYHELESVFLPLDLRDELSLELAPAACLQLSIRVEAEVAGAAAPADASNLAARAAHAFLSEAGLACALAVHLHKRVPVSAGLGGGSSDAGAVLRALAGAFPGAVPPARLAELALGLGADVPFFLDPRPALVTGIGEGVAPLSRWPALVLLLANPGLPLATGEVYRATDALRSGGVPPAGPSLKERLATVTAAPGPAGGRDLISLLQNDLEPAAVRLCPPIARLRERLLALGAQAVGLSGSGATIFGLFPDAPAARAALARLAPEPPMWARVAVADKAV